MNLIPDSIKANPKTFWVGLGSGIMSLLTVIAALPYSMGDVANIFPPQYKTYIAVSSAIAAAILKAAQGVVSADAKPSTASQPTCRTTGAARSSTTAMKFRKKPVVIEAEQYRDSMRVNDTLPVGVYIVPTANGDKPAVHTIHNGQTVVIEDGDWIIPEPDGVHFYPCKPDIFAATYEPA